VLRGKNRVLQNVLGICLKSLGLLHHGRNGKGQVSYIPKTGRTPGPGGASNGASRKMKLNCEERARWRRMVWILKIVEDVPPPCKQRIVGRCGEGDAPFRAPGCADIFATLRFKILMARRMKLLGAVCLGSMG